MIVVILVPYLLAVLALALYGLLVIALLIQYWRHRKEALVSPSAVLREGAWPRVTVQLPMYNERSVVERVIDAVAALDWPRDRLEIQVLDDSTDETTVRAHARIVYYQQRGVDIKLLHRTQRQGYKAGALAAGLRLARGEFIALFDADFAPEADFLKRLLPYFDDASVGFAQARWGQFSDKRPALARALALVSDGHFVVEQFARYRSNWPLPFNGSAGIWRRSCIEAIGGWHSDTLCEDMDLSYRAQLAGWQGVYAPDVVAPQETPASISALKVQQGRWAQGGAQCLRKHTAAIVTERRWSPMQKLMGLAYLAGYTVHLALVVVVLLWLPLALEGRLVNQLPLGLVGITGLGLPIEYVLAQWALHRRDGSWLRRLAHMPLLMVLGLGIAFNNALAVLAGLLRRGDEFRRTPKGATSEMVASDYRPRSEAIALIEIVLAVYAFVAAWMTSNLGHASMAIVLLLYGVGLCGVGLQSFREMEQRIGQSAPRKRVGQRTPSAADKRI